MNALLITLAINLVVLWTTKAYAYRNMAAKIGRENARKVFIQIHSESIKSLKSLIDLATFIACGVIAVWYEGTVIYNIALFFAVATVILMPVALWKTDFYVDLVIAASGYKRTDETHL